MAKAVSSHSEMAQARQSDGVNVIFDQGSSVSSRSRSRSCSRSTSASSSSRISGYRHARGRATYRGRYRSSSSSSSSSSSASSSSSSASSSSSRSTSRSSRSRSRPRCHRRSSRCRCSDHRRYSRGYRHSSPPRRYRAHSRSISRSPPVDRYSHRRRYRSRSRSPSYWSKYNRRAVSKYRCQFSQSPSRTFRARSRSRSTERSVALSLEEKRELLKAAKENAMKMLGVERLELPESVKPILSEGLTRCDDGLARPETRVRRVSENTTQSPEEERDAPSPKLSPKRMISFSVNNSMAKPTVAAPSCAKVTPRVDSVEYRKPYGRWIPVKSGRRR